MEQRHQEDRAAGDLAELRRAAHAADPNPAAGQQLGGEVAQGGDHARLDQLDLAMRVRLAGLDLDRLRIAVARRPAPQYVGDPDLVAAHVDLLEQLGQQRPGTTDERQPLAILLGARRLADEHQLGVGVAAAEDDVGASLSQRALRAHRGLLVDLDQPLAALLARLAHAPPPDSGIGMGRW